METSVVKKSIQSIIFSIFVFLALACASFENMSEQDAYDIGYGAGTLLRNTIK